MRRVLWLLLSFVSLGLIGCDVDFDPNASWEEQMNVYCLIDQDDDTTFVRIEKCFLSQNNAIEDASNKDSVYYEPEDLEVKLLICQAWDTNTCTDTLYFSYTQRAYNNPGFYSKDDSPIYYCMTKNKLSYWDYCKLIITNRITGKVVSAGAQLLADYSIKVDKFTFNYDRNSRNCLLNKMKIVFTSADEHGLLSQQFAKQYQINIRFNYLQAGQIMHADIPINKKINTLNNNYDLITYVVMGDVINGIKQQLKGKEHLSWYTPKPFEIRISACDLTMYDYMSINSVTNNMNYAPTYSNINGGIGLFSARRTHIAETFADQDIDPELKTQIKKLGLGF